MKNELVLGSIGRVTKFILASLGPLQYFLDSPGLTHINCLDSALEVLRNDNHNAIADFFQVLRPQLSSGLLWADSGWKNSSHYYCQPGKGIISWPGAMAECQLYFNKSLVAAKKDIRRSMFFLGASLHLIQDMCVPHHSVGVIFNGHQEFELWVSKHYKEFEVTTEGLYLSLLHPSEWIQYNAHFSSNYYPLVSCENNFTSYKEAAAKLIPLTIRTTAGFLHFSKMYLENQYGGFPA